MGLEPYIPELCMLISIPGISGPTYMGDNFFQKSLSFQLPLMCLQKSQYQILRVIIEK